MVPPIATLIANPLAVPDHQLASWFHAHLTASFAAFLEVLSEPGSGEFIGLVLAIVVAVLLWKKKWPALITLVLTVPGGTLLNEAIKLAVHRHRPFIDGPFVDWSGYSFASGHTIGATLLYGQLAIFLLPEIKTRRNQLAVIFTTIALVLLVGFSRIALGAHYLSDVLAAMWFGSIWLAVCLLFVESMRRNRERNLLH